MARRWIVRGLLLVATLVTITAIFAVWANRQILEPDNWADTSTELLENPAIRAQVAAYVVDQVYERVDVTAEVAAALPPRLDPLAGPIANGAHQLAERRTERLLGRPRVQEAWRVANRVTAEQFIAIAEGDSRAVTVQGNAVVLNLRVVVQDIVRRLGGSGKLVGKVPPDAGRITVLNADEVGTVQNAVAAVRGLSALLPGIAIALFALAVFLSPGRRRRTVMYAGAGFILAGLTVLVGRNLAGDYVVGELATTAGVVPAADAAWAIGTEMLRDVAQAAVIMGAPVVVAAWLAGPARPAVAVRRAAAPWLRTRPGLSYGLLAAVLLLVVAWGPIPATRMVLPVLLLIALAVSGLAVLRRQVAVEFPDAATGDTGRSLRRGFSRAADAMPFARHGNGAPAPSVEVARPSVAAPTSAPAQGGRLDELERLADLHRSGALTDDEFAAAKATILGKEPVP
jgi:hypothetical protein